MVQTAATRASGSPYVNPLESTSAPEKAMLTLPSGKTIPLEYLVQRFIAELIRATENEVTEEQQDLELERAWKSGLEGQRKDELTKAREESQQLKNTGKVRDFGMGATLALSGIAGAIGGSLLLGGSALVAGVLQMIDQFCERRGSNAVASFFSSFLPVSYERCQDATLLFSTFASIASSIGLSGSAALTVATGMTKAAFGYVEEQITERRDEHTARSKELDYDSELTQEAIKKVLDQISRLADYVQQFQTLQIQLAEKDKALKSSIFSMTR